MTEDTLRSTITTAIVTERDSLLQAKIDDLRKRHAAEVESAVDKALAAIRGKVKPKPPRKPHSPTNPLTTTGAKNWTPRAQL